MLPDKQPSPFPRSQAPHFVPVCSHPQCLAITKHSAAPAVGRWKFFASDGRNSHHLVGAVQLMAPCRAFTERDFELKHCVAWKRTSQSLALGATVCVVNAMRGSGVRKITRKDGGMVVGRRCSATNSQFTAYSIMKY